MTFIVASEGGVEGGLASLEEVASDPEAWKQQSLLGLQALSEAHFRIHEAVFSLISRAAPLMWDAKGARPYSSARVWRHRGLGV